MADPLVVVSGVGRGFWVHERRRGLAGAVLDWFVPQGHRIEALEGVNLELFPGEVVALLGANGAGKSTLIKCLLGLLAVDRGTVRVRGKDPFVHRQALLAQVGVVFGHRTQLWWDLAPQEAFDLLASLYKVPAAVYRERLGRLSDALDLGPLLRVPVRELSLGQRVRCDLAAGLLHGPSLLVLDEPTLGLDADVKGRVRALVDDAVGSGVAVLLATHDPVDLEALADRAVVLRAGRVGWEGSIAALRQRGARQVRLEVVPSTPLDRAARDALGARVEGAVVVEADGTLCVTPGAELSVPEAVRLVLARVDAVSLRVVEPTMDDVLAAMVRGG